MSAARHRALARQEGERGAITYAAIRTVAHSRRWADVPFIIRAGKCIPVTATEISNGSYEVHNIGVNWPHHVFVNQDFQVIGANE